MRPFTLNIKGRLVEYSRPVVMGILNITPDSFYAGSRTGTCAGIRDRAMKLHEDGADIIDIGAFSTRPGCENVTEEEELSRLWECMRVVRDVLPEAVVSVDTFRAGVAETAVTEMGADMVNDISGGSLDEEMFSTMARLNVPYILTHSRGGSLSEIHSYNDYEDFLTDVITDLAKKVSDLQLMGLNDLIIDPGFGFSKTIEQNYRLLMNLELFDVFKLPVLAGLSRKSMITRLLGVQAEDALTGTTVANTVALEKGAAILRVHDAKAARETIKIHEYIQNLESC